MNSRILSFVPSSLYSKVTFVSHETTRRGLKWSYNVSSRKAFGSDSIDTNKNHSNRKPKVIFVLGGPGAGKGTQCEKLSQEFGIKHLSAGELLREERSKPTENGRLIDSYLKEGKIVPVEISLNLLRGVISKLQWNRYLIDGFPRNWDNLKGWNDIMSDIIDVESILFIDCDEEELEKRLVARGKYSGRDDDNAEVARKRFVTFKDSTLPVVESFAKEPNSRLFKVNGCQPVEVVYNSLKSAVLPNIEKEILDLTQCKIQNMNNDLKAVVQVDGQSAIVTFGQTSQQTKESIKWRLIDGQWQVQE
eukprot:CAMPEP_0170079000 /NCGR_PEP_ID=MMETSP0019_2-20121128/15491_1 /TAXON_ID=98059 /ORGANISM="Dinobryon sp., Strain UTEXLB2267" /LENGTH=304 /DNA_ID=CAMNT_0010292239 /DNA_START=1 /DNA_END=915 /DNA_ORIENTATION=-